MNTLRQSIPLILKENTEDLDFPNSKILLYGKLDFEWLLLLV